uniref:Uncharacterized protein n=1 Tax=Setaria viridis TaxID=4556 RepID=A0A4V6D819_SETVI|nr:hypothetical protein SEVIR_4G079500v2 [Setaria viridis]
MILPFLLPLSPRPSLPRAPPPRVIRRPPRQVECTPPPRRQQTADRDATRFVTKVNEGSGVLFRPGRQLACQATISTPGDQIGRLGALPEPGSSSQAQSKQA